MTTTSTTLPAVNNTYAITNNSGVDIVVLDAFSDSSSPAPQQIYEQTLKPLSSTGGQTIIKAGQSGSVPLNDTHKDSDTGDEVPNTMYNLIIARADNLYPVAIEGLYIDDDTPPEDLTLQLSADKYAAMQQAESFQKTLMAFPSSNLATGYQAALSATSSSAGSDTDIDDGIGNFFKGTKQYQNVTLNGVVAITTYYSQFPYVWADYKPAKTYYLYSTDGSTCGYEGSLQINVPSAVPASADKSLPGFSFLFTDAGNSTKNLFYQNGQFVDDATTDMPGICLQGQFVLKSQFTKQQADNSVIGMLAGTVNGNKVMGYDEKQEKDSSGNWSGLYTLLHPKDAMGWLQLLMTASGVMMGLEFAVKSLKGLKDGFSWLKAKIKGEAPTTSELQDIKDQLADMQAQMKDNSQKLLDKLNDNVQVPDDLSAGISDLKQQTADRLNEDSRTMVKENIGNAEKRLGTAAEYGMNPALENAGDAVASASSKVNSATTAELPTVVPDVQKTMGTANTQITEALNSVRSQVDAETMQNMQDLQSEFTATSTMTDNNSENASDAGDGKIPDDLDVDL